MPLKKDEKKRAGDALWTLCTDVRIKESVGTVLTSLSHYTPFVGGGNYLEID